MPPFWQFLCRRWLGLSPDLAHAWWHAVRRSRWTDARTFYEAVLRFDQHPAPGQRPAEDKAYMSGLVEPRALMRLVESLVREGCLLRREASTIQEAILRRLDSQGEWRDEERRSA
jgi:hypothetical protein